MSSAGPSASRWAATLTTVIGTGTMQLLEAGWQKPCSARVRKCRHHFARLIAKFGNDEPQLKCMCGANVTAYYYLSNKY
jgi:hypothetical protein